MAPSVVKGKMKPKTNKKRKRAAAPTRNAISAEEARKRANLKRLRDIDPMDTSIYHDDGSIIEWNREESTDDVWVFKLMRYTSERKRVKITNAETGEAYPQGHYSRYVR